MKFRALAIAAMLSACDHAEAPRAVHSPREALHQLVRCTLDGVGEEPETGRFEGAIRLGLRGDRDRFATRAGTCETALETEGGRHACLARLRARWAAMLTVVQRSAIDAIDTDVAIRRVGEAYTDSVRACP